MQSVPVMLLYYPGSPMFEIEVPLSEETYDKALKILCRRCKFEVEFLYTGHICIRIRHVESDYSVEEIVDSISEFPATLIKMIDRFYYKDNQIVVLSKYEARR